MYLKKTLLGLIACVAIGSSPILAQIPSYVPQDSLVGWYPFNGNAGDSSGNMLDGTVNGASLTLDRDNFPNSAYHFNGTSDVITIANFPTDFTDEFTFSCWVKPAHSAPDKHRGIFGSDHYPTSFMLHWAQNNNQAAAKCGTLDNPYVLQGFMMANGQSSTICTELDSSSFKDRWMHIVYRYDGSQQQLFVNGALVSVNNRSGDLTSQYNTFNIGLWRSTFQEYFEGDIDEVGIWKRALSNCEVATLYNALPVILFQPGDKLADVGKDAVFKVLTILPNASYQWQSDIGLGIFHDLTDDTKYNGSLTEELAILNAQLTDNQNVRCVVTASGCTDTSEVATLTVQQKTGIADLGNEKKIAFAPNPATEKLSFECKQPLENISILDILGKEYTPHFIHDNMGNYSLDVSSLTPGTYFVRLTTTSQQLSGFKFMKK